MAKSRKKPNREELQRRLAEKVTESITSATMAIGVDVTWWGGSDNRRDDSHTECIAFATKSERVWSLPQFQRIDLGNFNPDAEPTEPNADPNGHELINAIISIVEAHQDVQSFVVALDAPLLAIDREPELPARRKSQKSGEGGKVERRLCDKAWAVAMSMSGPGWNNANIQPGAPLSPRIKTLVENFADPQHGFHVYQNGNPAGDRLIIECFPNEVIWSAGILNFAPDACYDSMAAYKRMGRKTVRLPLNILQQICAHAVKPCLNCAGLDTDEWFESLWNWMLSEHGRVRCDHTNEGKTGKCFDDAIDSMLSLVAAAAFVDGRAHMHQGDDPADGHIIGPGLAERPAIKGGGP
jgi:hypothetical protein